MDTVKNLEKTIGGWYKNVPHLPKGGQQWLADNVWWLALVGAILSVLGLFVVIPALLIALAFTSAVTTVTPYSVYYSNDVAGIVWLSLLVGLVSYIVTAVLLALAVNPLKAKSRKGWEFLFLSYLINFVLGVVSSLVLLNFSGIIGAAVGAAVGGYFLYEIHSHFVAKHKVAHKASAKV